jgi:hypothetical protein
MDQRYAPSWWQTAIRFPSVATRYVRVYGKQRATRFGYSLWEIRVFAE